jgi:hypothetical protein
MPKSRCWDRETIESVRDALANASDPPSTKMSTREAVNELADLIRAKRAAGWSRRDIVDFLKDHGVDIPETTLRTYASMRRASAPADENDRAERPHGVDAGIERGPGASDTRPAPSRPATRRRDDRVEHIEQDDV